MEEVKEESFCRIEIADRGRAAWCKYRRVGDKVFIDSIEIIEENSGENITELPDCTED